MKQKFCQILKHVRNLKFEIFQPQKINYFLIIVIFQCIARLNFVCLRFCGSKAFSVLSLLLKMFFKIFCLSISRRMTKILKINRQSKKEKGED